VMVGLHSAGVLVGAGKRFVAAPKTDQVAENLRDIYARTGTLPREAISAASRDPAVASEILAPRNVEGDLHTPALQALAPPEPQPHTPEAKIPAPELTVTEGTAPKPGTLIAPTPESVTPEHLTIFRTLEGNADGHAGHA